MKQQTGTPDCEIRQNVLALSGAWTAETLHSLEAAFRKLVKGRIVAIDGSQVSDLDTAGVVLIREVAGENVELRNFNPKHRELLTMAGARDQAGLPPAEKGSFLSLESIGENACRRFSGLTGILVLIADVLFWGTVSFFKRKQYRRGSFIVQAFQIGASALPITATILFLIGAILTLQSAAQLRQFGVSIYVVNLLAIGLAREFAPLMTAIIMSGRSGSAIASEIATMKFTEELDAIRILGLNPIRFVVVPKLWAMLVSMPLLSAAALFIGLLGGFVVAFTYLEMPLSTFINQLSLSLFFRDVVTGLIKSVSFAVIITICGAYHGFAFSGGADGVGRATTRAVVTSIFAIIAMDSIWGIIFYMKF